MKKKFGLIIFALMMGAICTYLFHGETKAEDTQKEIAGKVLRFHVLANSDSEEDQDLKMKVKEAVVSYLDSCLNDKGLTLEETKSIVASRKEDVIELAEYVNRENGYNYSVTAELTTDYFPIKSYGDVTLPAGEYEAFRIEIGNAEGKNWWCILYPPLCFVDASYGYVPEDSKKMLSDVLSEDCYRAVTGGGAVEGTVEVRFKIWDIIRDKLFK